MNFRRIEIFGAKEISGIEPFARSVLHSVAEVDEFDRVVLVKGQIVSLEVPVGDICKMALFKGKKHLSEQGTAQGLGEVVLNSDHACDLVTKQYMVV